MKHSFSLPSKPSSKSNLQKPSRSFVEDDNGGEDRETRHEFVTEFIPSETLPDGKPKHLIPRLENTWIPHKKMRNLDLPTRSSAEDNDLPFEVEAPSTVADAGSNVSYGLNVRAREKREGSERPSSDQPKPLSSIESLMHQKFKEDMETLPDEQSLDEYADVPVEGFGAALLSAYGWSEGMGIGKNAKEEVKVKQFSGRSGREGLGFVPQTHDTEKKGRDSDSFARRASDGPRELKGIHVGKTLRIVGGRHVGLKGKVVEKFGGDSESPSRVVLKLSRSGEEVTVGVDEVAELGSVEEERCLRKLQLLKTQESEDDRRQDGRRNSSSHNDREKRDSSRDDKRKEQRRSREEGGRSEKGRQDNGSAYQSSSRNGGINEQENNKSWLTSHIRVRIISKDLKGGRLYLKKGEVVDVVGPKMCDISMDDSKELIQGVHQDILETALPRRGGPILILFGKHKGVFGNLMERDMEKETAVVRDADSHELINVHLEQVAEYIGDPSYIGY